MNIEKTIEKIEALNFKSAWKKGVQFFALELLDKAQTDLFPIDLLKITDKFLLHSVLLNGARDWTQYSYGGLFYIFDDDIARRLCSASEYKKAHYANGELKTKANASELWLDVQARGLYQAEQLIAKHCIF